MPKTALAADMNILTDVGSSAKMVGLAGIEGFSDSAAVVFENPAGMYSLKKMSVSLFTTTFMNEVAYNAIAADFSLPIGRFGIGYMDASVGNIPITSQDFLHQNQIDGSFSYKSSLLKFSYQFMPLKNVSLGGSIIQYNSLFYNISALGLNAEVGAIIELRPLTLSIVARNLIGGTVMTYTGDGTVAAEPIPTQLVVSGKYRLKECNLFGQIKNTQSNTLLAYGVEYSPPVFSMLEVFGGFKNYEVATAVQSGYTMGLNLRVKGLQFQYAYEKSDYYLDDSKHYFSVSGNW